MYKIYKTEKRFIIYYYLCCENMVIIKWFYVSEEKCPSDIFNGGAVKLGLFEECIYESYDLQEASDYIEQIRILESV